MQGRKEYAAHTRFDLGDEEPWPEALVHLHIHLHVRDDRPGVRTVRPALLGFEHEERR